VASRPSRGSAGKPVPLIQRIVSAWPRAVDGRHVEALGFTADTGIDEVVEAFIEDDLEMQKRFACARQTPLCRHPHDTIHAYAARWLREQNPRSAFPCRIPLKAVF